MTEPATGSSDTDPRERPSDARVRRMRQIATGGAVTGFVLALGVGFAGGTGRAGMAVLLLVTTLGLGMTSVYGMVTTLIDEFRNRPVSRARMVWMIVAFFGAAAMMAMVAAVGG